MFAHEDEDPYYSRHWADESVAAASWCFLAMLAIVSVMGWIELICFAVGER